MKKRTFILLVLVMLATVGLGTLVVEHQGYVLISWKQIRFESTLWVFLACLAALFAVLYILRLLAQAGLSSIGWVNPWSGSNQQRRLQAATEKGLQNLAEGNWGEAMKQLEYAGTHSRQPLPFLLDAARAAQQLAQDSKADKLLSKAKVKTTQQKIALALCRAELLIQRNNPSLAITCLQEAQQLQPQHPELILRLSQLAEQLHDWVLLLQIMPSLRKSKRLPASKLEQLELAAWQGRLSQHADNMQQVDERWQAMAKALQKTPELILTYCSQLLNFEQQEQAHQVLRKQLDSEFDSRLLLAFAQLPQEQAAQAVKDGQRWAKQHMQDAMSLYALGKLCIKAEQWVEARDYLQESLVIQPNPKVYAELARLLNQMGDTKRSIQLLTASINMHDHQTSTRTLSDHETTF